jgi:hypothetical protein
VSIAECRRPQPRLIGLKPHITLFENLKLVAMLNFFEGRLDVFEKKAKNGEPDLATEPKS